MPYARLDVDAAVERQRFPSRVLALAESAAVRASLHVAMGRPAEARILIQEAKAADPTLAVAHEAEAVLLDRENAGDKALTAYGKAVELGSTSFYTHYRLAQLTARGAGGD